MSTMFRRRAWKLDFTLGEWLAMIVAVIILLVTQ